VNALKRALRALFLPVESALDKAFGPRLNPVTQLGTLGWFLFWIVIASGIYVYIFFDTGLTQAWESLERLSRDQWWLGGIMRSLHRYASDALVIVVLLHALREFAMDRMRGNRWFPWLTGVSLIWFLYVCGITGYWLVWDQLAQYVAIETTQWLDSIGIFSEPIARNFIDSERLSGRFFTLMAYIHIAVPLLMLLFMWIHIQRHAHARVNPHRALGIGTLMALVALSLVRPAMSQAPADLDSVPLRLGFDWFYLGFYPLLQHVDGRTLWAILVGGSVFMTALAWLPPQRKAPAARVDLPNCNGCARCFADCPYGAITMVGRTDGLKYEQQAQVVEDMCMSCGICVGACPTATPFRSAGELTAGIELPERSTAALRAEVVAAAAKLSGDARIVVFGCTHDAHSATLADAATAVIPLPCAGMLPPPFIDFVLSRGHADGVLISGCAEHDCFERLGDQFTEQRIANQRDPNLRGRVPRERVAVSWNNPARRGSLRDALAQFRTHLAGGTPAARSERSAWRPDPREWPAPARYAGQLAAYAAIAAGVGYFSTQPSFANLGPDDALLKLSFIHAGEPLKPCRRYTPEELTNTPFNQRRPSDCERGRWPVTVELDLDGQPLYRGTHEPAGLWNDGPSSVYARFEVPAGRHRIDARLRDDGSEQGFDYSSSETVEFAPGQSFVVDFSAADGGFVFGHAVGGPDQGGRP
jgi:ferredoxin/coenzyme F420-reducing hydrogenase delta subunit